MSEPPGMFYIGKLVHLSFFSFGIGDGKNEGFGANNRSSRPSHAHASCRSVLNNAINMARIDGLPLANTELMKQGFNKPKPVGFGTEMHIGFH